MINLEWEELDRLEVDGKLEQILKFSYDAWISDPKNTHFFVRAFFLKWYLQIDNFDIESYEEQDEKLRYMYSYGEQELLDIPEVKWIMGYCLSLNPECFMGEEDYDDLRLKGKKYLREASLANPEDVFLKDSYYASGGKSVKEFVKWESENREQLANYLQANFNYDSLFSDYFKEMVTMYISGKIQEKGILERLFSKLKKKDKGN
ncbi:TPA: hypothetical protein U0Z15_000898 [Listeria monocytogenes]|uniref:Uncharacterized protein n=1 Tax=Listeria monocytogenes TaxID=1639 RepID=A0A5Z1J8P0_LISMN|nr:MULTISPECIES: hypothetical protein [Listeria]EAE1681102.1 hypothetical protein [Listeria monocytogenes LIS0071]MCX62057.1 hypothetical protein [Listeria monocytogenes serotype 4b]AGR18577.1 hypothetical protein M640_01135 [Listeria monocytogenes]AGR21768.1 hypothetical protein M644_13805 [Listeria monocytogenes]AGR24382.1 hypothetical protein M645_01665 [Listeria monocytogenes]